MVVSPEEILTVQLKSKHYWFVISSLIIALHEIGVGTGYSFAGVALPYHRDKNSTVLYLTQNEGSWYLSVTPIFMSIGTLLSIPLTEVLGRVRVIAISNAVSLIGLLMMFFTNIASVFLVGRVVQTLGTGLAFITGCVYLNECSTVRLRGAAQSLLLLSVPIGSFTVSLLPIFTNFFNLYIFMMALHGILFMGIEIEIEEMVYIIGNKCSKTMAEYVGAIKEKRIYTPLLIQTVMFTFIASSGNDSFYFYGPTIFSKVKLSLPYKFLVMLPGGGNTIGYFISIFASSKMNRRTQICLSAALSSIALIFVGYFLNKTISDEPEFTPTIGLIVSVSLFSIIYAFGFGSVPYTLCGELFNIEYRAFASNWCQNIRTLTVFGMLKLYPLGIETFGAPVIFWIHAGINMLAALFGYLLLPETRGKTLTELNNIYSKNNVN